MNTFNLVGKTNGNLEVNNNRLVVNRDGKLMPVSIMVRQKYGKKDDSGKYPNEFFTISIFGHDAEYVAKNLAPNGRLAVEGHMNTFKKDGNTIIGLVADRVYILDFKDDGATQAQAAPQQAAQAQQTMPADDPFAGIADGFTPIADDPFAAAENPFA